MTFAAPFTAPFANLAWTPAQLPGVSLWTRADLGTYQSNGGSAASADGDPVGYWTNQAGSNHPAQTTTTAKPTLKLNILNGKPVLRFDGGDWLGFTNDLGLSGSDTPFTWYLVIKMSVLSGFPVPISLARSTTSTPLHDTYINQGNNSWRSERRDDASSLVETAGGASSATTSWAIYGLIFAGTTATQRVNKAVTGSANDPLNVGAMTVDLFTIGGTRRNNTPSNLISADIAEVVVCSGALGAADIATLEAYFGSRYSL